VRILESESEEVPTMVATAASRRSFCKSASDRLAPRSNNTLDVASAMPEAAPVTAMTLSERGNTILEKRAHD